jgi:hypothetical protein
MDFDREAPLHAPPAERLRPARGREPVLRDEGPLLVFEGAFAGELIGAAAGLGLGFLGTVACAQRYHGDGGGCLLFPVLGVPGGAYVGAAVGGAVLAPRQKGAAIAGSILGSAVSVGGLVAIGETAGDAAPLLFVLVPAAILAPPGGAALGFELAGDGAGVVVRF